MADLRYVTYCGLYCGLCGERARIPQRAQSLRESMSVEGWDQYGPQYPGFDAFWNFLSRLCDPDTACPGCRSGGGPPFCAIRKCAVRRGVEICAQCTEYPCQKVLSLARGYPTLIADGRRLSEIGTQAWIREQEERARSGFVYADIRCHPYEVPEEAGDHASPL